MLVLVLPLLLRSAGWLPRSFLPRDETQGSGVSSPTFRFTLQLVVCVCVLAVHGSSFASRTTACSFPPLYT